MFQSIGSWGITKGAWLGSAALYFKKYFQSQANVIDEILKLFTGLPSKSLGQLGNRCNRVAEML